MTQYYINLSFTLTLCIADISSCRDKEAALSVSDLRMRHAGNSRHSISRQTESIAGIAKSILVLNSSGASRSRLSLAADPTHNYKRHSAMSDGLALSRHATIGRNSNFHNLTEDDRVRIGGIEYRSLQLLLRIVFRECFPHTLSKLQGPSGD